jgi:RNA recognition motif-containing protein
MNIYVANINWNCTDSDLRKLFEDYGTMKSCRIMTDRETRKSRGFAFVEMPDSKEAQSAINNLHEYEFMNRPLVVNEAKPPKK